MDKMYNIAQSEGILVQDFPLRTPLKGIYICESGKPPLIGLSTYISTNIERRCIMAEELGHHFTTAGNCVPCEFYSYNDRITISRMEYRALKWAAYYLLPEHDFLDALKSGLCEVWELAEHFDVTEEFVKFRLRLFGARDIA